MKLSKVNRSPLFYVGDKYKLISEIKTFFPDNIRNFVEPFVGGGSAFLNVDAESFYLNDINNKVISLHKMLNSYVGNEPAFFDSINKIIDKYNLSCSYKKDIVPCELKVKYPKTYYAEYNKNGFYRLRDDFNKSNQTDLIMLYVLLIYGFNRMIRFNSKGEYNLPVGNVDFNQNTISALKAYFNVVNSKQTHWFNTDFESFINELNLNENDLVYLDPPYLITFSEYNKLWNNETEHRLIKLLDNLNECKIRFAISNVTHYKGRINSEFLSWSEKYNTHSIKSNYISYHDNTIKNFNEVLVTNY
jgi:DNA adenine methylase